MKCPHCSVVIHDEPVVTPLSNDEEARWAIIRRTCPACKRFIFHLQKEKYVIGPSPIPGPIGLKRVASSPELILVWPKGSMRPPCPAAVPQVVAEDYKEACLVLTDSPKASAALSRRCLQNLLQEVAKVKPGNLFDEIQEVINNNTLPPHLAKDIDAIRIIGNFAAHPTKSQKSGEIYSVEPGEAEWNLDVLEGLFNIYCVQPTIAKGKRDALNKKLRDAGKPPMVEP